jgi:hypothetical protein
VGPLAALNTLVPGTGAPMDTRWLTRSGWRSAVAMEVMPPIELPTSAAFSMPSSSMKPMSAATWS